MKKIVFLLSLVAALSVTAVSAQETPEAITVNAAQAFLLAGAGYVVQPAALAAQAQQVQGRSGMSGSYGNAGTIAGGGFSSRLNSAPTTTESKSAASSANDVVAQARAYMANPPYNPNNGTHDWNGWCLGFVATTLKAVGKEPSPMGQASAKDAYFAMAKANLISNDTSHIPAGAPIFWPYLSQWGHVAIATGQIASDGSPMMITTSSKGIREMSVKQFGEGMPVGWGKIK